MGLIMMMAMRWRRRSFFIDIAPWGVGLERGGGGGDGKNIKEGGCGRASLVQGGVTASHSSSRLMLLFPYFGDGKDEDRAIDEFSLTTRERMHSFIHYHTSMLMPAHAACLSSLPPPSPPSSPLRTPKTNERKWGRRTNE